MPDIIVKQQPATSLTVQPNSTQLVIRQIAANNVTISTGGSSYVLPAATNSTLGGIIVGSNLTIANGVLSATSSGGGVTAFNNRTGDVTLTANDVTAVANGIYQANGSYLSDVLTSVNMSYGAEALTGMRKSTGIGANFLAGRVTLGTSGAVGVFSSSEASAIEFSLGSIFATLRIRQYAHTLIIQDTGFEVETGTANWSWSANSILTQGRGDARYQAAGSYLTSANLTWSNLTGKPTFATVATSGDYNDLANKPASYTLPTASNTTLGGVKVGQTLEIANGVLNVTDLTLFGGTATASGPDVYFGGGA